jgi:hypothetical protein
MRFTIRDLLWLTVVVALGVAWWSDHEKQRDSQARLAEENSRLLTENNKYRLRQLDANTLMDLPTSKHRVRQRLPIKTD